MDDARLLAASAVGDREAFAAFYRRHLPVVIRFLVAETRDRELAADLTVEVFATAMLAAGRYRPEQSTALPARAAVRGHRGAVAVAVDGVRRREPRVGRRHRCSRARADSEHQSPRLRGGRSPGRLGHIDRQGTRRGRSRERASSRARRESPSGQERTRLHHQGKAPPAAAGSRHIPPATPRSRHTRNTAQKTRRWLAEVQGHVPVSDSDGPPRRRWAHRRRSPEHPPKRDPARRHTPAGLSARNGLTPPQHDPSTDDRGHHRSLPRSGSDMPPNHVTIGHRVTARHRRILALLSNAISVHRASSPF